MRTRLDIGMAEGAGSCYLARLNVISTHVLFGLTGLLLLGFRGGLP